MKKIVDILSENRQKTQKIAQKFAKVLKSGDVVVLIGDLGAGKTVFAGGIASRFSKVQVTSPSFSILNVYDGKPPVFHFDFYRLENPDEIEAFGAEEFLFGNGISIVKWPARAKQFFDKVYAVKIDKIDENKRKIQIVWGGYEEIEHFGN